MVLLIGAGLLGRSLLHLQRVSLGFQTENVMQLSVTGAPRNLRPPEQVQFFQAARKSQLAAMPGVESLGATCVPPYDYDPRASVPSVSGDEHEARPDEILCDRMAKRHARLFPEHWGCASRAEADSKRRRRRAIAPSQLLARSFCAEALAGRRPNWKTYLAHSSPADYGRGGGWRRCGRARPIARSRPIAGALLPGRSGAVSLYDISGSGRARRRLGHSVTRRSCVLNNAPAPTVPAARPKAAIIDPSRRPRTATFYNVNTHCVCASGCHPVRQRHLWNRCILCGGALIGDGESALAARRGTQRSVMRIVVMEGAEACMHWARDRCNQRGSVLQNNRNPSVRHAAN